MLPMANTTGSAERYIGNTLYWRNYIKEVKFAIGSTDAGVLPVRASDGKSAVCYTQNPAIEGITNKEVIYHRKHRRRGVAREAGPVLPMANLLLLKELDKEAVLRCSVLRMVLGYVNLTRHVYPPLPWHPTPPGPPSTQHCCTARPEAGLRAP